MSFAVWFTVVLGTIVGAVHTFGGFSRLCTAKNAHAFEKVYGVFLGCPGTPLRFIIALGEVCIGIGILVCIWADAFNAFEEKLSDTSRALVIVAGVATMNLEFVASFMHYYVDGFGKAVFPGVLASISLTFVLGRTFGVEPPSWERQLLAIGLSTIMLLITGITMLVNKFMGVHEALVKADNEAEIMNS